MYITYKHFICVYIKILLYPLNLYSSYLIFKITKSFINEKREQAPSHFLILHSNPWFVVCREDRLALMDNCECVRKHDF